MTKHLKELAKAATKSPLEWEEHMMFILSADTKAFIKAAKPSVVLALIERIEDCEQILKDAKGCINGTNSLSDAEFIDSYFKRWSDS